MTTEKPRNLAASVRQRLMNLARARNEDFQLVLTRYALERLLYRLSRSEHRDVFVLKGAMLFQLWGDHPHRPTRDLDLLGTGDNSVPRCERIFREVCALAVEDDGLLFNAASVRGDTIKQDQEYEGLRLNLDCRLENARIRILIDIGFGDVVTSAATEVTYPVLLDFPALVLPAYSRESVGPPNGGTTGTAINAASTTPAEKGAAEPMIPQDKRGLRFRQRPILNAQARNLGEVNHIPG